MSDIKLIDVAVDFWGMVRQGILRISVVALWMAIMFGRGGALAFSSGVMILYWWHCLKHHYEQSKEGASKV